MIVAIVTFPLPAGTTLDSARQAFEASVPNYEGVPGLIRKYYLYDAEPRGGGVYLWESREAAERLYSEAWKAKIVEKYGAAPTIDYFEAPVIVDNGGG